jgi:hypothetical protein
MYGMDGNFTEAVVDPWTVLVRISTDNFQFYQLVQRNAHAAVLFGDILSSVVNKLYKANQVSPKRMPRCGNA